MALTHLRAPATDRKTPGWRQHPLPRRLLVLGLLVLGLLGSGLVQAAGTAPVAIGAVVLSKNICKFNSAALTLPFGTINAISDSDAIATATLTFKCAGTDPMAAYSITQNGGLHKTGVSENRMKHATLAEYLPYSLSMTPAGGTAIKNDTVTVTIQGLIQPSHFQNVRAGAYADTVVLSITP